MTSETYIVINIKCFISIFMKSLLVHKPGVDQKRHIEESMSSKDSTNNFRLTIHPIN